MDEKNLNTLFYDEMETPVGSLVLSSTEKGLCSVDFGTFEPNQQRLSEWALRWIGPHRWVYDPAALQSAKEQLKQYFRGDRQSFHLEMALYGTEFQKKVWQALIEIPYGKTVSYKTIAAAVGSPKGVRAVGGANNRNPIPILIPCHRVIGADGQLVGYGGGLQMKTHLLQLEGYITNKNMG